MIMIIVSMWSRTSYIAVIHSGRTDIVFLMKYFHLMGRSWRHTVLLSYIVSLSPGWFIHRPLCESVPHLWRPKAEEEEDHNQEKHPQSSLQWSHHLWHPPRKCGASQLVHHGDGLWPVSPLAGVLQRRHVDMGRRQVWQKWHDTKRLEIDMIQTARRISYHLSISH